MQILLVGETSVSYTTELVGSTAFSSASYSDMSGPLRAALGKRHSVEHMPAHCVPIGFPVSLQGFKPYAVVILSDVGAATFLEGSPQDGVDRLALLAEWVRGGGGLLMIGGFLSFSGVEGKARYGRTALAPVLPVELTGGDDRQEAPAGATPVIRSRNHGGMARLLEGCPPLLGWNSTAPKPDASVLATIGGDPLLAVGEVGRGRTAAFTSDCAPHWGSPAFLAWHGYDGFWCGLVDWLAGTGHA